jgi:hypothetical protein
LLFRIVLGRRNQSTYPLNALLRPCRERLTDSTPPMNPMNSRRFISNPARMRSIRA